MAQKAVKQYLTIEETANTLRVSERTVRRWIASGFLPGRKIAKTVRVPATAVRPEAIRGLRPFRGRPRRTRRSGEPDLAMAAVLGGSFDWLLDPREDVYTLDDGEPL